MRVFNPSVAGREHHDENSVHPMPTEAVKP